MSRKRNKSSRDQKQKAKLAKREAKQQKRRERRPAEPWDVDTAALAVRAVRQVQLMWSPEKIRRMETEQILAKLDELGVDFDEAVFRSHVERFYSAYGLGEHLWGTAMDRIEGRDADFPWMAAAVLWERLYPEIPNTETFGDGIDRGSSLLADDLEAACDEWLRAWEQLKRRFVPGARNVETVEERAGNEFTLQGWMVDLAAQLGRAGRRNPQFLEKQAAFCTEVRERLPDSPPQFLRQLEFLTERTSRSIAG